jgi:hypothetical protein
MLGSYAVFWMRAYQIRQRKQKIADPTLRFKIRYTARDLNVGRQPYYFNYGAPHS